MNEDCLDSDSLNFHNDTTECQCEDCTNKKDQYVRVVDIDKFVDNLKDWD